MTAVLHPQVPTLSLPDPFHSSIGITSRRLRRLRLLIQGLCLGSNRIHARLALGAVLGKEILLTAAPNGRVFSIHLGRHNDPDGVVFRAVLDHFATRPAFLDGFYSTAALLVATISVARLVTADGRQGGGSVVGKVRVESRIQKGVSCVCHDPVQVLRRTRCEVPGEGLS